MNISDIKKRYGLKNADEARRLLRDNLKAINSNGEHAVKSDSRVWTVDEEGIQILDEIVSRRDESEDDKDAHILALTKEKAILQNQVDALKDKVSEVAGQARQEHENFEKLSEEFMEFQNKHGAINQTLIYKNRQNVEALQSSLSRLKSEYNENNKAKSSRIAELEERVAKLTDDLSRMNEIEAQSLETKTALYKSRSEQDKLLRDLQDREDKISELMDELGRTRDSIKDSHDNAHILSSDVQHQIGVLQTVVNQLQNTLAITTGKTPAMQTAEAPIAQAKPATPVVSKQEEKAMEAPTTSTPWAVSPVSDTPVEDAMLEAKAKAEEAARKKKAAEDSMPKAKIVTAKPEMQEKAKEAEAVIKETAVTEYRERKIAEAREQQKKQQEAFNKDNSKEEGFFARLASRVGGLF